MLESFFYGSMYLFGGGLFLLLTFALVLAARDMWQKHQAAHIVRQRALAGSEHTWTWTEHIESPLTQADIDDTPFARRRKGVNNGNVR